MGQRYKGIQAEIRMQCKNIRACRKRVLAASDTEALHDLRVAIRKLRSTLAPFEDQGGLRKALKPIKRLAAKSNPLRDAEVQIALLAEIAPSQDTDFLLAHSDTDCANAFRKNLREPIAPTLRMLKKHLKRVIANQSDTRVIAILGKFEAQLVHELAHVLPQPDQSQSDQLLNLPAQWHAIRLLCKRLRYFREAHRDGSDVSVIKASQDALGYLRDMDLLIERFNAFSSDDSVTAALLAHARSEQEIVAKKSLQVLAFYIQQR